MSRHSKALTSPYPGSDTKRAKLAPEEIAAKTLPNYEPPHYDAPVLLSQPVWADKPKEIGNIHWNQIDNGVDRRSFETKQIFLDDQKRPLNPRGRTGLRGRGLLGRYGPNHAADPIVTRWKRDSNGNVVMMNSMPVMEFVAVQRKDNGEWAIPGGMVDAGEHVSRTVKREFGEEALNSLEASAAEKEKIHQQLDQLFAKGQVIYQGYVDDPRNTDNAWMETTAVHVHDEEGTAFDRFNLQAGDDAGAVQWKQYSPEMPLYASHQDLLAKAYERACQVHQSSRSSCATL